MTKRLIVAGCGAFARELINWAEDAADAGRGSRVTGFLDLSPLALEGYSYDVEWRGNIDDYVPAPDEEVIVSIGDPAGKRSVVSRLMQRGAVFGQLIHPSAVIARTAVLGAGVVVCPQSVISSDAHVGDFVAVNALCTVGHDVRIGAYSTLSPSVDLTGFVKVGEGVFFGCGAKILPKLTVGAGARVGAGTTVMRSVPENAVLYTAPAKKL